jgi:hypothetical protein
MWNKAEQLAMLLNDHGDFISAYRRVYALAEQMQNQDSSKDFSVLDNALEGAIVALLDVPCSYDVLPQWTGALNAFLDCIKVQEEPFAQARLGLLRQTIDHFSVLGPLVLAM